MVLRHQREIEYSNEKLWSKVKASNYFEVNSQDGAKVKRAARSEDMGV